MFKIFEFIVECFGWIRIFISPFLIGIIIACFIYFPDQNLIRLLIAVFMVVIGMLVGIFWANWAWKKEGTMQYLSKVDASPDLDNIQNKNSNENPGKAKAG